MAEFAKLLHFKSIQTKMTAAILMLVVLPMLFITFISFTSSERFIQERISQSDSQMLEQLSSTINSVLEDMIKASNIFTLDKQIIDILSNGDGMDGTHSYYSTQIVNEQMDKAKNTMLLNFNSFICIYDFYGNMYSSGAWQSVDGYEKFKKSEWFNKTVELNGYMLWIAPQYDYIKSEEIGPGALITLSRMIKGTRSQGGYGIITISIGQKEFFKKLVKEDYFNEGDEVYLINSEGIIASHLDSSLVGKSIKDEPYIQAILAGGQNHFISEIGGKKKFVSYSPIGLTGWIVVKVSNYDTLFRDLLSIRNTNILYIFMISLIFIFVTSFIVISITRPLKKLRKSMKMVEEGNMDISVAVRGTDEVAQLGNSFNSMLLRINALIENIREKQKKEEELRLEVMQAQINPHFLFNTLNTIKWTAIISQAQNVANLIEALGRILEMSVKDINVLISVHDELENLKSYIQLQKARYNQRFIESIKIDKSLMDLKVPKLVLQPLVENSIIHGLSEERTDNLNIEISGKIFEDYLILTVHDDGVGIEPQKLLNILDDSQKNDHRNRFSRIGLQNVHKRIQLMFGEKYGLKIRSISGEGTDVEVRMPIITGDDLHGKGINSR